LPLLLLLLLLLQVRTMQEHVDLMNNLLARDVTWDAPPILIRSREDMWLCTWQSQLPHLRWSQHWCR
jgi:hypothetical protein